MQHIIESPRLQAQNVNTVSSDMFIVYLYIHMVHVHFYSLFVVQGLDREPSLLWRH